MRLLLLISLVYSGAFGQNYSSFQSTFTLLDRTSEITDQAQRTKELDNIWNTLIKEKQIPFIVEDSVLFLYRGESTSVCDNPSNNKIKISMTSGLFNDTSEGGQKMKGILESNSCVYTYREVNEGHSWGNWRNLIDDILIDLLGNQ